MGELWPRLLAAFKKPLVWWVVIAEWEQGVRVRLGKRSAALAPGIHLRVPFLDRVYVQSVRLRTIEESGITVTTKDGQTVTLSYALSFSIIDILTFYRTMASPEQTLTARAAASLTTIVAQLAADDVQPEPVAQAVSLGDTGAVGLSPVEVAITGIAKCRTYRLLSNTYRSGVNLHDLDGAGER